MNVKNIYRVILYISFAILFTFLIMYAGDELPEWKWYASWSGILCAVFLYLAGEFLGEEFHKRAEAKFSIDDYKQINMLLFIFILLIILSIPALLLINFMKTVTFFFSILSYLMILSCNETFTTRYANFKEAKEDNLLKGGWVPNVLPINTGEIAETHNIDTNERCAEAVIPSDSIPKIEDRLKVKGYDQFESKLPALPSFRYGSNKCTFTLKGISSNRKILARSSEITVLDIGTSKFYYWSF